MPSPSERMSPPDFDVEAFYVALDRARRERRLSWREISRQAGVVSVGVGTQLGRGQSLRADNLVRLMVWLGTTDLAPFIRPTPALALADALTTTTEDR